MLQGLAKSICVNAKKTSGGGFSAAEFNFTNIVLYDGEAGSTNTVTMSRAGTLAISMSASLGPYNGTNFIYKNGVAQTVYTTSALSTTGTWGNDGLFASFAVSIGDTVYFYYYAPGGVGAATRTVDVRNATFNGTLIDQHTVQFIQEGG